MRYVVKVNSCRCHPETCCCNDWAIFTNDGEKHSTYFHESTAHEVAEALNNIPSGDKQLGERLDKLESKMLEKE